MLVERLQVSVLYSFAVLLTHSGSYTCCFMLPFIQISITKLLNFLTFTDTQSRLY